MPCPALLPSDATLLFSTPLQGGDTTTGFDAWPLASHGKNDPYAVRVGTRPANADIHQMREAQSHLSIHVLGTASDHFGDSYRIVVTATPDAEDIHDDIVEHRLAAAFDNLRVASDGSMWGNTTKLPYAVSSLALDGWQAVIENVGLSNEWN